MVKPWETSYLFMDFPLPEWMLVTHPPLLAALEVILLLQVSAQHRPLSFEQSPDGAQLQGPG